MNISNSGAVPLVKPCSTRAVEGRSSLPGFRRRDRGRFSCRCASAQLHGSPPLYSDIEVEGSDESSDEDGEDTGNAAAMPTPSTSVFPSNPAACMREVLGAAVSGVGKLAAAPRKTQEKLTGALHARRRERMLLSVEAGGLAPARDEAVRLLSSSDEGGAWLRAIPYDPSVRLANGAFRGAVAFRLGVPQRRLQRGPDTCDCHRAHDERARVARARAQRRVRNRGRRRRQRRQRRRPKRVDGRGEHDMTCAYGNPHGRHARYQAALVSAGKDANQLVRLVRHTTVRELRVETDSHSQKQADVAIDLFGPEQVTALADFVVCHPTAATYVIFSQARVFIDWLCYNSSTRTAPTSATQRALYRVPAQRRRLAS